MPLRRRGKVGKTRRQIRRENRGWTFSSSSPRAVPSHTSRRYSSPRHIENYAPFQKKSATSSSHSAWKSVSSKRSGHGLKGLKGRQTLKTRKSRK